MINSLLRLFAASMKGLLDPGKTDRFFAALPEPHLPPASDHPCVCALQMEAKTYPGIRRWLAELDSLFADAASQGADLVCLPELYAMTPYLIHPVTRLALKFLPRLISPGESSGQSTSLLPILLPFRFVYDRYEDIIARFARRYQLWIFGGTGFVCDGGQVYNRGFLVSPTGTVEARQDKIHLTAEEISMGLSAGDILRVVPTPLGNIALSVCMDATYFETFRVAKALGADMIIVPIGDMAAFDHWLALRGAQMRVNETGLAAIKPALVSGPDFPILFTGKAGIYFPTATGLESVEHSAPSGSAAVFSRFSLDRLRTPNPDPFLRQNPAFARNYFRALDRYCQANQENKGDNV